MARPLILLADKTVSSIVRSLNELLDAERVSFTVLDGGFDSWLREMVDGSKTLQTGAALGFLLSPRVLEQPDAESDVARVLEVLARQSPSRTVLFSNVFPDPDGVLPLVRHEKLIALAAKINSQIYAFSQAHPWFHVVDHAGLAIREGTKSLTDARFEATAQMYFSPGGGRVVAATWLRVLRALETPSAKVLVVDLDNTLWRGIVGEDGPDGIDMSTGAGGWAFRRLQKAMLELKENGILLAVSSKNNPEEALGVLRDHADCLVRPQDFAAIEIGWGPKSEALRRIANKLNLGLDAFVFLDDSAFEREEVRGALAQVRVVEFPDDPNDLVGTLSRTFAFDSNRVTQEDRERAKSYAAENERLALREQATSPEAFYRSLSLKLTLFRAQEAQSERLHQLILKTNQFNLTSERLSGEAFRELMGRPDALVVGMRVSDRFGDSGITGLAIVTGLGSPVWVVENFLLSCRVIGRTVENGFLAWLSDTAVALGAERIDVKFRPTARNQVAQDFLTHSGLSWNEGNGVWQFELEKSPGQLAGHFVSIDTRDI